MPKFRMTSSRFVLTASLAALLSGCAVLFPGAAGPAVNVAPNERLYLTIAPFDSAVRAGLSRAGLDPDAVEKELDAEIRYGLFLRGQREAADSAGAAVAAHLVVTQLQPGYGRAGDYAAFVLTGVRRDGPKWGQRVQRAEWTWEAKAKDNAPPALALRHLARQAAGEVLARLRAPKKEYETPPPLHLMR